MEEGSYASALKYSVEALLNAPDEEIFSLGLFFKWLKA
jgi:hypothetical protein